MSRAEITRPVQRFLLRRGIPSGRYPAPPNPTLQEPTPQPSKEDICSVQTVVPRQLETGHIQLLALVSGISVGQLTPIGHHRLNPITC